MANGWVNVRGVTNAEIEAVEEILNDVITLLGATTNTGGTVTAGTIMAKLNKALQNDIDLNTLLGTTANTGGSTVAGTVMAKLNKALQNDIDINTLLGATTNTGGTATAGTVMAKLNKLLTDWTTARAGEIDAINNNIGTTANTGGTNSAGTVMAKLNKLLTDWTTTRAGRIDTINNNIGTTTNTGGTATAGTVMAKLNAIIAASNAGLKVKSVQHGYVKRDVPDPRQVTRSITINTVDVEKSVMIINTFEPAKSDNSTNSYAYWTRVSLNPSSLIQQGHQIVSGGWYEFNGFSYWIVEFE